MKCPFYYLDVNHGGRPYPNGTKFVHKSYCLCNNHSWIQKTSQIITYVQAFNGFRGFRNQKHDGNGRSNSFIPYVEFKTILAESKNL